MTMKAIVCYVLVLILTGPALLQLRSIRLGLASSEWNVARGRILSAFVDDDGSDGDGGELLHSANIRGDITRCVVSFLLAVVVAVWSW